MGAILNWLSILTAAIVGMTIAYILYSVPTNLFDKPWRKMTGIDDEKIKKVGKTPQIILLISIILTAIGLDFVINISWSYFTGNFICFSLFIGFITWLTFSFTTLWQHNAFEQKPAKLTLMNLSYQLVLFLSMSLIIGLFGQ